MLKRTRTFNNIDQSVRVIYFAGGNQPDPYVLSHADTQELYQIGLYWQVWLDANQEVDLYDGEELEGFIDWLQDEKGFFSLVTIDEPIHINF